MTLSSADEFRHEPGAEPNWQENYMFLGWDEDRQVGIYLHLGHLPHTGVVDARMLVSLGGRVVSAATDFGVAECLAVPWLDVDIVEPLLRWKLRCETTGTADRDADGWLAFGMGDVSAGFDIDFHAVVPLIDFADVWPQLGIPNIFTSHYEGGSRWAGRAWIGDTTVECNGLLIRDHSWGPRDLKNAVDLAWWWPAIFEDGPYVTGTSLLRDGRWVGVGLREDGDGPVVLSTDPWVRIDGFAKPNGFQRAQVSHGPGGSGDVYTYDARLHTPVYYESMGSHRLDDVFSVVTGPDGRIGFGNFELNLPRGRSEGGD